MSNTYTAEDIVVRDESVDIWSSAVALSEKYGKPVEWIEQGLLACELGGVGSDYFILKYLEEDHTIPINREVSNIAMELQKERRNVMWGNATMQIYL